MMIAPEMLNAEEFSQPVESIMRCEDFKSNFARKLSNRYIIRPPVASRQDNALKLPRETTQLPENAPERIECVQLSKSVCEQSEAVKTQDKKHSDIRSTEVSALNIQVEMLRWQLSQTEANRQMHIELLKQVVSFLSRVKEHIECQKPELGSRKEYLSARATPRSFNVADLPRSRSVVHVNKNLEFSLSPAKKMNARKISKSICNVNGYKDSSGGWSPTKLFSTPEEESTQKISEEMTRLITLANTVLSTQLPDLACTNEPEYATISETAIDKSQNNSDSSWNLTDEDITNAHEHIIISNTACVSVVNENTNNFTEVKHGNNKDFIMSPSPLPISGFENDFAELNIISENTVKTMDAPTKTQRFVEKRNEYNHAANFIEDESGFSSMSSFQEIGIPIISIIPPSPCKEAGYIDDITDILEETKWKSDPADPDKQSVKVFWV